MPGYGVPAGPYQAKFGRWVDYEAYKALRSAALEHIEQQDEVSKRLLLEEINREKTG